MRTLDLACGRSGHGKALKQLVVLRWYPSVIKHGNGKSHLNGAFNRKILHKWLILLPAMFDDQRVLRNWRVVGQNHYSCCARHQALGVGPPALQPLRGTFWSNNVSAAQGKRQLDEHPQCLSFFGTWVRKSPNLCNLYIL